MNFEETEYPNLEKLVILTKNIEEEPPTNIMVGYYKMFPKLIRINKKIKYDLEKQTYKTKN